MRGKPPPALSRSGLGRALVSVLIGAGIVVHASGAHAQSLRGRLLDVRTEEPLGAGILTLLTEDSSTVVTAVTDAQGHWHIAAPEPGMYYILAKRLGYEPWVAGPVEVHAGEDLNSVFHLRPLPVRLDPIEVTAEALERRLELAGFYNRQRADFGHFMTPEEIEHRSASALSDLLSAIPGVQLISSGLVGSRSIQLRGSFLSHGGVCRPRVYVDGLIFLRGDSRPKRMGSNQGAATEMADSAFFQETLRIDDIAHPSTVAAIEIYRSGVQTPAQFGGASRETQCGVIVIWTRAGVIGGIPK